MSGQEKELNLQFEGLADRSSRSLEEKRMWSTFQQIESVPITMTVSEFSRYIPIFSSDNIKAYEEYTQDELARLQNLSTEFHSKINLYKPLVIIDDTTGKEIFTLPPICQRVNALRGDGRSAVDILRNRSDTAFDQPWKIKEAVQNLSQEITNSMDREVVINNGKAFLEAVYKLHQTPYFRTNITGPCQFIKKLQQENIPPQVSPKSQENGDDGLDDLCF